MACHEFSRSLEVETTFDQAEGPVYPPVTSDDGVVMACDDFLGAVLRDNSFVVSTQPAMLEVLTLVVIEITCGWLKST